MPLVAALIAEVAPTNVRVFDEVPIEIDAPLLVVFKVPPKVTALGAVAITPPVKLIVSEPLPKANVPVLAKVVVPAIVLVVPLMATL